VEFSCVLTEQYTYGGVTLNAGENVLTSQGLLENVDGGYVYSFSGMSTQPLGAYPGDMPVEYKIRITVVSGQTPAYTVRQTYSNRTLLLPGIVLLLAGIVVLVVAIVKKPKTKSEGPAPVIISPTLGGFGYAGGGSGTGGVAIQPRKSSKGAKKKKKKKRPASRAAPKAGAAACPFCGSMVPSGAYYCPNCYGKIK